MTFSIQFDQTFTRFTIGYPPAAGWDYMLG